jgi:Arc/MetJ-type ribon-helix-helix transcriptional regulator
MVIGMATSKITITLQGDQVRAIRELVAAGQSPNMSAFVQHAVNVALSDAAGWRMMLDDALLQTGGALTDAERAWADALLNPLEKNRTTGTGAADRDKAA